MSSRQSHPGQGGRGSSGRRAGAGQEGRTSDGQRSSHSVPATNGYNGHHGPVNTGNHSSTHLCDYRCPCCKGWGSVIPLTSQRNALHMTQQSLITCPLCFGEKEKTYPCALCRLQDHLRAAQGQHVVDGRSYTPMQRGDEPRSTCENVRGFTTRLPGVNEAQRLEYRYHMRGRIPPADEMRMARERDRITGEDRHDHSDFSDEYSDEPESE